MPKHNNPVNGLAILQEKLINNTFLSFWCSVNLINEIKVDRIYSSIKSNYNYMRCQKKINPITEKLTISNKLDSK